MTDIRTSYASPAGAASLASIVKQATILFTSIVNVVLPYLPFEFHGYAADLIHFNERFPILLLAPIVLAVGYVVASVSGLERAFAEIGKAILIVLFTVGPVVALSDRLTLIGACIATLVAYLIISVLIDRISRPRDALTAPEQVISYRR